MQSIYNLLWDKNILYFSKGYSCIANHIQGDCILSANTTLNYYYESFESNEIRNERKSKGVKYISRKYLNSEFFGGNNKIFESLELQILNSFLSLYHTIGNYMPIPLISKYKDENFIRDDVRECTKYQCEEYFKKATQIIKMRRKIMIDEIKKRL